MAFHDNSDDVRSLFTLHQAAKASSALQRHLGPANKGTYLLVAALWETYCEDVLLETTEELVTAVPDPDGLPLPIRRAIARDLKDDKHELGPWKLAGDGWRSVARARSHQLCRQLIFNSPKSGNVDELFLRTLGLPTISQGWRTERVPDARATLDEHLVRRGELAHRAAATTITKRQVSDFYQLARDLSASMDARLGEFLLEVTGHNPYQPNEIASALSGVTSAGDLNA